jgi:hypothetical protein
VKNPAALSRTTSTGHPRLAEVARLLSALKSVLHRTARRAVPTDISAIEKLLADRASMEAGAWVQMVAGATARSGRTSLALRGCATTWSLNPSRNSHQHGHGQARIAALAKEMTGSRGRAQDAALKKIWKRHQSLLMFKAKSRAAAGRSAAYVLTPSQGGAALEHGRSGRGASRATNKVALTEIGRGNESSQPQAMLTKQDLLVTIALACPEQGDRKVAATDT